MSRKPSRPSQAQIERALVAAKGYVAMAARALGVHHATLRAWLNGSRTDLDADRLNAIQDHERALLVDQLEVVAFDEALNKRNTQLISLLLRTQGADRGYGSSSRVEVTGADGEPVQVQAKAEVRHTVAVEDQTLADAANILASLGLLKP